MGGPGSGGSRVNSGPAGKSSKLRWLSGNAGHRTRTELDGREVTAPSVTGECPEPPAEMPEEQQRYWRQWAPLSHARGMLDSERTPGFELLCRSQAQADMLWAEIGKEGFTFEKVTVDGSGQEHREPKAHPLLSHYRGLEHRVEQLMARYGLGADGKIRQEAKPQQDDEREALAKLLAVK